MASPIPTKKELRTIAAAAISANTFISTNEIGVVVRNGRNDKEIEKHLNRKSGNCVVIEPLQEGQTRDQSGPEVILDCLLLISVKQNTERNGDDAGGADVDILDVLDAVTNSLTRKARHPGGEFFQVDKKMAWSFSGEDEGLWQYVMFFTKESA